MNDWDDHWRDAALRLAQEVDNLCEQRIERNAEIKRLREALRGLITAVTHSIDFEPEWNVGGEWTQESTDRWMRIEETLDANIVAARKALAEKETV